MKCCICGSEIVKEPLSNWDNGNNALPVKNGRCCNLCNDTLVFTTRMRYLQGVRQIKENPNQSFAMILQTDGQISLYKGMDDNEFTLKELQTMVGGNIEVYPLQDDDFVFLVDEEGLLKELPLNHLAKNLFNISVVGNVVIISKNMLK